jgi:hypothetical protein
MIYVDLDTMEVCSHIFLQKKHSAYKLTAFTSGELLSMNAALLDESTSGDVATGNAISDNGTYRREYRNFTPEEIYNKNKVNRSELVSEITVTTLSGKTFDGDEDSQNRMARAISAGNAGDTTGWKLADNTWEENITWEELREALLLAGQAQTAIWNI